MSDYFSAADTSLSQVATTRLIEGASAAIDLRDTSSRPSLILSLIINLGVVIIIITVVVVFVVVVVVVVVVVITTAVVSVIIIIIIIAIITVVPSSLYSSSTLS